MGTLCYVSDSGLGELIYASDARCAGAYSSGSPAPSALPRSPTVSFSPSSTPLATARNASSATPVVPRPCAHLDDGLYCGADAGEAAYRAALANATGLPPSAWCVRGGGRRGRTAVCRCLP